MAPVQGHLSLDMSSTPDTPYHNLNREEVTRLLVQTLADLGYEAISRDLAGVSGLESGDPAIHGFIQLVYQGAFVDAEAALLDLGFDAESAGHILYLVRRERFLELLMVQNNRPEALRVLRSEITPLGVPEDVSRQLACILVDDSDAELCDELGWLGTPVESRERLVEEISKFVPPERLLPPHRLATLLNQAISHQREKDCYHVRERTETGNVSLYKDYRSNRDKFPSRVIKTLNSHSDEVWFVRFSNTGKYLCSASSDSKIIIYDVENDFRVLRELVGSDKAVMYCSWSPDDNLLLTCGLDLYVRLWDVRSGTCLESTSFGDKLRIWSCEWLPDSSGFLAGSPDKRLWLFNSKFEVSYEWPIDDKRVTDLAVFPNGKSFITVNQDHSAYIYDIFTKKLLKEIKIGKKLTSVTMSQDSRHCIINVAPEEVQLWDLSNYTLIRKYYGQQQARYVIRSCFGNWDESFILSGSEDGRVYIWNREFGNLIYALEGHKELVNCVDWNRNGTGYGARVFATAGDDHTVKIWGV
ncbi:unnamed protein product [Kuraishia capsulata CBS 1993]|uniref:Uncharacterized protein n=1 Tax=Kuraishia capsulata CBS 1993 TaxID=1382522 RepID=W6MTV0_9ASCO|nr:uncharacterized protein KUCA_T00005922001 [Kuraishia capsulata CBS 1993]CDK29928.1 unnamed protein product [Kuraishia capsulata CBS 1993]